MIVESISGAVQLLQGILTKTDSQGHTSLVKVGSSLNPGDSLVLLSGESQLSLLNGLILALTPNQPFILDSISPLIKQSASPAIDEMVDKALAKSLDISKFIETLEAPAAGEEVLGSGGTAFIVDPNYAFGLVTSGYQTRGPFFDGTGNLEHTVMLYGNTKPEAVLTLTGNSLTSDESIVVRNGDRNAGDQIGVTDPFNFGTVIGYSQGFLVSSAGSVMNQPAHFVTASYSLEIGRSESGLMASNGSPITLSLVNHKIVAQSEGKVIFAIGIDEQTGKITVVQYHGIYHPDSDSADESISLTNLVKVTLTLTDKSGDVSKATIDVGGKIYFEDDAPFINHIDSLLLDDNSNLNQAGTIVSGTIDVDFGSDLAKNLIFSETAIASLEQINLTSNGRSLSYTLDDTGHVLTATATDANGIAHVIFTLTLSEVIPNSIQQEMPKYHLNIVESVDQPTSSDAIHIVIPIRAIDADNDSALGDIVITIDDGDDAQGGITTSFTLTEGDLDALLPADTYPVQETHTFSIPAGADRLVPESLIIEDSFLNQLIGELQNEITAGGSHLTVTQTNLNGEITLTAKNEQGDKVFEVIITSANDTVLGSEKNLVVTVTLTQIKPLDHQENGDTNGFVRQDGERIHIDLQLQAKDSDGDPLQSPVTVEMTILDGAAAKLGTDQITFTEQRNAQTGIWDVPIQEGNVPLDLGSDTIATLVFEDTQTMQQSLNGLTSGGWATSYSIEDDGKVLVLRIDDSSSPLNGQEILKVTVDTDGKYTAILSAPLDQTNNNQSILTLNVRATDKDGDPSDLGTIEITVNDAVLQNTVNAAVSITEGSISQGTYPVSTEVDFTLKSGADRLLPGTVVFDQSTIGTLISELNNEIKVNGEALSFEVVGNTIIGSHNGTDVLIIELTATQNANHYDADVTIKVTLNGPIDHNQSNNSGLVILDGDEIAINIGVQIQDSDGDSLDNPALVAVTVNDGPNPLIVEVTDPVLVRESDIDPSTGNHEGSNATGAGETASGTLIHAAGSDDVVSYRIDENAFNNNAYNYGTWTSGNKPITLALTSANTYTGSADGVAKFTIVLNNDGSYTFTLLGSIDHPNPPDGVVADKNFLDIIFPVIATDADGDDSLVAQLPIRVEDDIPSDSTVVRSFTEGGGFSNVDLTSVSQEGADTGVIISVTAYNADGTLAKTDLNQNGTTPPIDIYDENQQKLGTLTIQPNGTASFTSLPNIDHNASVLQQSITYTIRDADGDEATGTLILNINDRAATVTAPKAAGVEDVGRDEDKVLLDPALGIPINMSINIGDADIGETLGQVTIRTATVNVHGTFYYEGVEIPPTTSGANTVYNIPIGAFVVDNSDPNNVIYTLANVTYVPDADYATAAAGLNFTVSAIVYMNGDSNQAKPAVTGTLNIDVKSIADIPVWDMTGTVEHYNVLEDGPSVDLNLLGKVTDIDTSETIEYYLIKMLPDGNGALNGVFEGTYTIGTGDEAGYIRVNAGDINTIQVNPNTDYSGVIRLEAIVVSKEASNFVLGHEYAQSAPIELVIDVAPVADPIRLNITKPYLVSYEDDPINISELVNLTKMADNLDNSENTFIRISGIPVGATFKLYEVPLNVDGLPSGVHNLSITYTDITGTHTVNYVYNNTNENNPYYQVSTNDLNEFSMKPVPESNVDFTLTIQGVVIDTAELSTGTQTSELVTNAQTVTINMKGVADVPIFVPQGDEWTLITDPNNAEIITGIETTIQEDGEAKLNFNIISGEKALAPTDTSETLTMVISGLPAGAQLWDRDGNTLTLTYVGLDGAGQPKYEVNLSSLTDLVVIPPPNSTKDIYLNARIVVTENDGDVLILGEQKIVIHITPVIDAGDYSRTSAGLEDEVFTVNWIPPQFSDSQEHIAGIRLENVPTDGSKLFIEYNNGDRTELTIGVDGKVDLSDYVDDLVNNGAQLKFQGPEDSDVDVNLNVIVTVRQWDADDPGDPNNPEDPNHIPHATKDITGSLHLNITAVVESDAALQVLDMSAPGTPEVTSIVAVNGLVDLSAATGQYRISFQDKDGVTNPGSIFDSVETIKMLVINFPNNDIDTNAARFTVIGGIYNGVGWVIPESELDNLQIISNFGYGGIFDITIHAQVQDMGDNGENDVSEPETRTITLTLTFDGSGGGGSDPITEAGTITINPAAITGQEDAPVTFGEQLEAMLELTNGTPDDVYALIIDGPLPDGFTLSGTGVIYDFANDRYVITAKPNGSGGLDVGEVILETPEDYAGSLPFDINWTAANMASGDVNQSASPVEIPVNITPIADVPTVTLQVVQTEGLDDNLQPGGNTTIPNLAYEDGLITLNLNIQSTDNDSSENITSVLLRVDPAIGTLLDSNGDPLAIVNVGGLDYVSVPVSGLTGMVNVNVKFSPAEDYSGPVQIIALTTINDTVVTGTDTQTFTQNLNFSVIPVNDTVTFSGPDHFTDYEDTFGGIGFTNMRVTTNDIDGSEQLVSLIIHNVPEGFLIGSAQNLGDGDWKITVNASSFDLSNIKLIPPDDFSGSVVLEVTAYTKEALATLPKEAGTHQFTVEVAPLSDVVDIIGNGSDSSVTGMENGDLTINLNVQARDDTNSYTGTATNVTENPPENLLLTIHGVPEGASISLPVGVSGTVTSVFDTNSNSWIWTINVNGAQLPSIIYSPGDTNGLGELTIDVQAVDGSAVPGSVRQIVVELDVIAVNDAPVNIVPTEFNAVEDTSVSLTGIQIVDIDAREDNGDMTVTLQVGYGIISIIDGTGVSVDGNNSNTVTLTGTIDAINAVLAQTDNVMYQGNENFNGSDELKITTNDLGNSGEGGPLTTISTVPITIEAVNDAPVNTVPGPIAAEEDIPFTLYDLSVTDVDAGTEWITVTLSVENGTLKVGDRIGVTVEDNETTSVKLQGSVEDINHLLALGVIYQGNGDFHGTDSLTMTTNDNGNTGSGGPLEVTDVVPITVNPRADTPDITVVYQTMVAALGALIPLHISASVINEADNELTVRLDGLGTAVPVDSAGNQVGTSLGGGSWQLQPDQLNNLYLSNLAEGEHNITATAVSDVNNGPVEESMPLPINVTVIDSTLHELQGGIGNDYIIGFDSNDVLIGDWGDDVLIGGGGDDTLIGGPGNDTLTGGGGIDTFIWMQGDDGTVANKAVDIITDFKANNVENSTDASVLNLADLLSGENADNLDNYLNISTTGSDTRISINPDGQLDHGNIDGTATQTIILQGVDLTAVFSTTNSHEIINHLVANGNLITDS
ncbi:DUF5801 repeats-in-toxin domain-containing protein [Legionella shakespearei]|uniref:Structural toxin protein RtxA n=1 Tax=Legionella shakespearei DSM 23087 TaxID=1122169 RepID=A0A0W0YVP2_9GAMM|nr:DUF5801 repeats-in-toxin domain-containing protein [Legionella shakespearei]KTD60914.1 structural toxin protein RtxA [Legionella shakespearei DSM 23087]